jgi:hypothetical protein
LTFSQKIYYNIHIIIILPPGRVFPVSLGLRRYGLGMLLFFGIEKHPMKLRKLLKFGPVRTLRVLHEVAAIINDLHEGTITVFDIKKEAEDLGVKVVFDTNYNIIEAGIFEEEKYGCARKKIEAERMNMYKSFERDGERLWTHPDWSDEYVTH